MGNRAALAWLILVFLNIAALGLAVFTISRLSDANKDTCIQVQALKEQIVASLERSKKALPTIRYYKDHPAERRASLYNIYHEIHRFQPTSC